MEHRVPREPFKEPLCYVDAEVRDEVVKRFSVVEYLGNGFLKIQGNGLVGLINRRGLQIVEPTYRSIYPFVNGYARVEKISGKFNFIDIFGKEISTIDFDWAEDFEGELAIVKSNGNCGMINTAGKLVCPMIYHAIWQERDCIVAISSQGVIKMTKDGAIVA